MQVAPTDPLTSLRVPPHTHARLLAILATLTMILGSAAVNPARASTGASADLSVAAPSASVSRPILGESFTLSGSLGPGESRVVRLQRYHDGDWQPVQKQITARTDHYSFVVSQSSWRMRWRVLAPGIERQGKDWPIRISAPRTLFGQPQAVTTSMARSVRACRQRRAAHPLRRSCPLRARAHPPA